MRWPSSNHGPTCTMASPINMRSNRTRPTPFPIHFAIRLARPRGARHFEFRQWWLGNCVIVIAFAIAILIKRLAFATIAFAPIAAFRVATFGFTTGALSAGRPPRRSLPRVWRQLVQLGLRQVLQLGESAWAVAEAGSLRLASAQLANSINAQRPTAAGVVCLF